jgi:membrane-bound metal-dependent hydrolase YbcI (DUF457 family)
MPSPIGHALGGLAVHLLSARNRDEMWQPGRALLLVGAAVAPDLDLLLRFVDGVNHHQGGSHSLAAAVWAGLAAGVVAAARRVPRASTIGLAVGLAWGSHLLLDYLGRDTHPPIGLPLLWPFADSYFKFPWPVFLDIGRTLEWRTMRHNIVAVAWEIAVLLPIPATIYLQRRRPLSS